MISSYVLGGIRHSFLCGTTPVILLPWWCNCSLLKKLYLWLFFSYSKLATRECFILLFQGYGKQIQIKPMDGKWHICVWKCYFSHWYLISVPLHTGRIDSTVWVRLGVHVCGGFQLYTCSKWLTKFQKKKKWYSFFSRLIKWFQVL